MLEKLEFFACIDFFLSETARFADVVLPGSLHEEDEGTVCSHRGAGDQDQPGGRRRPGMPGRTGRSSRTSPMPSAGTRGFTFASPREIFEELRRASRGGVADYSGITYEKIERQMGVFWPCPTRTRRQPDGPPGHAAAVRAGVVEPGRQGGRAVLLPGREGPLPRDPLRAADRGRGRRLPGHPDHRPGGEHVPVRDPDPADRPPGGPVPGAAPGAAPDPGRASTAIADGDWVTVESRRGGLHGAVPGGDDDPPGHGLRPVPLGRGRRA